MQCVRSVPSVHKTDELVPEFHNLIPRSILDSDILQRISGAYKGVFAN